MATETAAYPLYEGLFLLSQGAASNLGEAIEHLKEFFNRAEAEVVTMRKWDDRRLAYTIDHQKRGTFVLAFFRVKGTQIANIERDCNLSEKITRHLIIRADHVGEAELELEQKEVSGEVEAKLRGESAPSGGDDESSTGEQEQKKPAPAEAAAPAQASAPQGGEAAEGETADTTAEGETKES